MTENKFRAVLIDDEPNVLDHLQIQLEKTGQVSIVAKENKPNMGLRQIAVQQPDIVFLDADMPEKNGISLLKEMNELNILVYTIVISTNDQFVFDAFNHNAADFLLKPIKINNLNHAIQRFKASKYRKPSQVNQAADEKLLFPSGRKTLFIKKEHILYLKADGNYSQLITSDGNEHLITKGLGVIEKKLSECFFRVSRSAIINTEHLSALLRGKKMCMLTNGKKEFRVKASTQPFYELEERYC